MTKEPLSLGPEGLVSLSTRVQAKAHRLGVRIPDNRLNSTTSNRDVKRNRDGFETLKCARSKSQPLLVHAPQPVHEIAHRRKREVGHIIHEKHERLLIDGS